MELNTKAIVAAIIVGSIIISAGIALRKTEFEACYDKVFSQRIGAGYPVNGANEAAFRICGKG